MSNGVEIPVFGFGCAFGNWTDGESGKGVVFTPEEAWAAIPRALNVGITHFDCAYVYRTHRHVGTSLGAAFRDGTITRGDVFLTTKVYHPPHPKLFGKTLDMLEDGLDIKKTVKAHILESLDELGVGYVDLLLVHWPGPFPDHLMDTESVQNRNRILRKKVWDVFGEFPSLSQIIRLVLNMSHLYFIKRRLMLLG